MRTFRQLLSAFRETLELNFRRGDFAEFDAMLLGANNQNFPADAFTVVIGFCYRLSLLIAARREAPFRVRDHVRIGTSLDYSRRCAASE